jgi:CMP-N-acetylneuraminic acid synthetase
MLSGKKSAVSITEAEHHPWKMLISGAHGLQPLKDYQSFESPRQLLPKVYRINGAMYCLSSELFLDKMSFYIEPAYTYPMSQLDSLDIDSELDLKFLEFLLQGS